MPHQLQCFAYFPFVTDNFLTSHSSDPSLRLFLLAANVLGAFASTGVVLGVLTTNRQTCSVATATIAANFHQTLDVQGFLTAEVTFYLYS